MCHTAAASVANEQGSLFQRYQRHTTVGNRATPGPDNAQCCTLSSSTIPGSDNLHISIVLPLVTQHSGYTDLPPFNSTTILDFQSWGPLQYPKHVQKETSTANFPLSSKKARPLSSSRQYRHNEYTSTKWIWWARGGAQGSVQIRPTGEQGIQKAKFCERIHLRT